MEQKGFVETDELFVLSVSHLSIHSFIHPPIISSIHSFIHPSIYPSIHLSIPNLFLKIFLFQCDLSGHISDVNCCKFFPSGEVIASGGVDMTIRIWSAINGTCPVTLKGHKGGVTDIAIVDKGCNIVCKGKSTLIY